ncbi:DUF3618 domain-containing protein [uncultured Sphingomonas sp.]|uniref:DUF3618 domain-containing protein n=1 Tax=uncultured Sphingomonas sp. TaxID=158754 RepID=UPI00261362ED|nr:DUF3618 domain-containing protein [uncultured Sphingomonas sp.]
MSEPTALDRAEARAADARARMTATLGALQTRLAPRNVAQEAIGRINDTGARALDAGVVAAKRHPGKIAGGIALLAAFLGRRHIAMLIDTARKSRRDREKPAPAARVEPAKHPPRAERTER